MRKLILSSGHGGSDPGSSSGQYIERDLTISFRKDIALKLKNTYGITALIDPDQNAIAQTLAWLKGKFTDKDILLDIHWNSGGGSGVEVVIPDQSSPFERSLAMALANDVANITGLKKRNGGVKPESLTERKRLGWMRPNAENILIEVCFIDNKTDMAVFNSNRVALVKAIAKTLADFSKL